MEVPKEVAIWDLTLAAIAQNVHCSDLFCTSLDGRNRAIVIAESLARVIAAIRITSVCWRSYLFLKFKGR